MKYVINTKDKANQMENMVNEYNAICEALDNIERIFNRLDSLVL